MSDRKDLDLYRPTGAAEPAKIARGVARAAGILVGLVVGLYGVAMYFLRCFDTCPTGPAENAVAQLLAVALALFGLAVVLAAASARTRWSKTGLGIVTALGCLVALCGVVSLALAPAIDRPADRSSTAVFGVVTLAVGAVAGGVAFAYARRG